METDLGKEERDYIRGLMTWDRSRRSFQWILANISLMFGGAVIVTAALFTHYNMTNATAQWITLPSIVIGLVFIGIYVVADQRIRERRKVISILRKLEFGIQE